MRRFFRFLSDSLLFCACCVFPVSILNPFLTVNYYFSSWGYMPVIRNFTITYWSYMASFPSTEYIALLGGYWFNDFDPALARFLGVSWILVAMFLLQILTLTSGILSLLKARKMRIISFVSSAITVLLMIQVYARIGGVSLKIYQLGYWFAYPSIFLFLSALIFDLYSDKEKTPHKANTITSSQNKVQ